MTRTPRFLVVGTAGHIDHGKSTLVKALTGTDPDRLKEEKERGITIDLGFAFLTLRDGARVAFVDVPGHERFVKNMLAGAGGIDAALLVVAADESVMPQTREHLDILTLLRIPRGIVVLTKSGLADADMRALAEMEVRELTRGTFLENAPVVAVDAITGDGLPDLTAALARLAAEIPERTADRTFRLPVDRSFALKGFGTVVTGTTSGGRLAAGAVVTIYPSGKTSRVRTIEVAGNACDEALPGRRAALNLPDLEVADVARGDVVALPGLLAATRTLHVRLEVLATSPFPLEARDRVRLHLGAAEVLARVRLLQGTDGIRPGTSALASLTLESSTTAVWGDRFVLRRYSPVVTMAGGTVLLGGAPPGAAPRAALVPLLERMEEADLAGASAALVAHAGIHGATPAELAPLLGYPVDAVAACLARAGAATSVSDAGRHVAVAALAAAEKELVAALRRFHQKSPLAPGMPLPHLRGEVLPHAPADVFGLLLATLESRRLVVTERDVIREASFSGQATGADAADLSRLEAAFHDAGVNPPAPSAVVASLSLPAARGDALMARLVREGKLRRLGGTIVFHASVLDALCEQVWALAPARTTLSVPEFKELIGTSRKYAIPLLEHLDARRVTARAGDVRRILPRPGARG